MTHSTQENSLRLLLARVSILLACLLAVSAAPARGQPPTLASDPLIVFYYADRTVPPLVRVTSSFHPADGQPPAPVETMTLSIYGQETGGAPLWQETQRVAVNPDGRFTLLMGSTRPEGLPLDLFASGEPRWLAVHVERPGEGEPGRVLLASVPSAQGAGAGQNQKDEKPALSTRDPKAPIKPKLEDFDTREAYEAAKDKYYEDLTDYKVKQAATAEKQRADDLERRLAALEGGKKTQVAAAGQSQTQGADAGQSQTQGADAGQNQTQVADAGQSQTQGADAGQNQTQVAAAGQSQTQGAGAGENQTVISDILSRIRIFGRARLDVIYNTARPQAPGTPVFLVPKFEGGFSQNTIDINARNSLVGVAFAGPMIGNFQSGGRISAVFFDNTIFADRNGFLLTESYGELFNDRWRFAAGLQLDVIAPLVPTVLPFTVDGAPIGNNIKGQIRVERFVPVGSDSQLTLQAALSEPLTTAKTPDISLDEDNGLPNVEGRIALGLGKPAPVGIGLLTQRPLEVALSGMVGQLRRTALPEDPPRRVVSDVWLAAVDFQVNLARFLGFKGDFGFKGEVYTGQGLGNYGGGILQSLDAVTWKAIRTKGGWVEGFVYLTPGLHSHTGIFIDDPNDDDITAVRNTLFGRTYNSALYSTLIWDLDKRFRIALEATYRKTDYKDPASTGRLPNEGFGFHTQFQWAFDTRLGL